MAKIYISSTFEDLKDCRQAVYTLLEKMQRHQIIKMENYVAADQRPLNKCLEDVATCDVYVGIFAWRYGYIPSKDNPEQLSITEREFRKAVEEGKHCLVFLLHEQAPWPHIYVDKGYEAERIEALRKELATDYTASFFHTAEKLAGLVSVAVSNWENAQTPPGIDPKPWQQMLAQLSLDLQKSEEEKKEWIRKYRDLDQQLAMEGQDNQLAQQAQTFLHAGQLHKAGMLLDQVLASSKVEIERIASYYFSRGQVFDLQFQLRDALPHYAKAYQYCPENPTYAQAYADTLQKQKHYREAEPVYMGALQTLRSLAASNPAIYLPYVAMILNNLGILYSDTQQLEEAAASFQEALTLRRQLAAANPAACLPDVAGVLNNLGLLYRNTQRLPEAEERYQEALMAYRQLATTNPAAYLPDVAMTLNNLGVLYCDTQRLPEAEERYQEALMTYCQLATTNPAAYLPDIAMTLNNLGILYRNTHRFEEADKSYQEALTTYRRLAAANPAAYLSDVAKTLNNLGLLYRDTHRLPEAEEQYQEALMTYRQLAAANPAAYLPYVAGTLNNLGNLYRNTHRFEEADKSYQEALTMYHQLAAANPAAYLPDVAMTLNNLGLLSGATQQFKEAEERLQEALTLRRQLATANPAAYLPDVAMTLNNLGLLYEKMGQPDKAKKMYQEAQTLQEQVRSK